MPGVFPEVENGAVIVRGMDGICTGTLEAPNAYCPPATFTSTCAITALTEDCVSRIKPSQINALVSEILCLASMMTPEGNWDCASNCNLADAFEAWVASFVSTFVIPVDAITIEGGTSAVDPIRLKEPGAAASVVSTIASRGALATGLLAPDPGNLINVDANNRLFVDGLDVVTAICADNTTRINLSTCLLLPDAWNLLDLDPNGRFYVSPSSVAAGMCADATAPQTISACVISTDASNAIHLGSDGKLHALADASLAPDYLQDGAISNNAGTPLTAIDIAPYKKKTGILVATLLAALTKNINGTWVAGNNGGLDTGVKAANTTYFVYALRKTSDGSGEVVLSTSPTVAGVNTALLAGYVVLSQIGVIITDAGSNIRAFTQSGTGLRERTYLLGTPVANVSAVASQGTAGVLRSLTVPIGVPVQSIATYGITSSPGAGDTMFVSSIVQPDVAAVNDNAHVRTTVSDSSFTTLEILTDTLGRVRTRQSGGGSQEFLTIITRGWKHSF